LYVALNFVEEVILISCGIEFQILTPWYEKDCSFAVLKNSIAKEDVEELRVLREYMFFGLEFWLRL